MPDPWALIAIALLIFFGGILLGIFFGAAIASPREPRMPRASSRRYNRYY